MQPSSTTKQQHQKDDHAKLSRTQSSLPTFMWQQTWGPPPFDTSMPPPPPRTPWELEPPGPTNLAAGGNTNNAQKQHKNLSRQLSLNPNYDPRIHGSGLSMPPPPIGPRPPHATADFSYPPPPVMHPHGGSGGGPHHHMTVTRNSSAPEDQQLYNQLLQQKQQQVPQQPGPPLHKTHSDGLVDWPQAAGGPLLNSSSIWDSETSAATSSGKLASRSKTEMDARSNLYYHLAKLFPEDQVRNAMTALPDETDPHKICLYILYYNKS